MWLVFSPFKEYKVIENKCLHGYSYVYLYALGVNCFHHLRNIRLLKNNAYLNKTYVLLYSPCSEISSSEFYCEQGPSGISLLIFITFVTTRVESNSATTVLSDLAKYP